MEGVILVFWDSIAYGAWDLEKQGWVNRLREWIDKLNFLKNDFYYLVYNLGVSDDTTQGLLKRIENEIESRRKGRNDIIIFQIGINDSQYLNDKNKIKVSCQEFEKNLEKLFSIAKKFTDKIIFISLIPVDENKVDPLPWDKGKSYKNSLIKEFNKIIEKVCRKENVYFVDIWSDWVKRDYKELLEDGIHPNSKGHQEIFEKIKHVLVTWLGIRE